MFAESADPDTGSARSDFRIALEGLLDFYASPTGRVFAQLVSEAKLDPVVQAELRDHLVQSRRKLGRAIWERGDRGRRGVWPRTMCRM